MRRRQAGVLVVGLAEPEIQPWVRAAGHAVRAVRDVRSALAALDEEPADLVIVDREPGGLDVPGVCRRLRSDHRIDDAWLLALTIAAHKRTADAIVRALMVNVPGAIYRSAWHANFTLELISDEIERISGYPAANFIASKKRTLWSIIHPEDREKIQQALNQATDDGEPFGLEYRIVRADGEVRWVLDRGQLVSGAGGRLWCDGAIFDVTERRAAEEAARAREIDRARNEELHASRRRIVEAADNARRKIERDLHDGEQQRLVALALEVRMAKARVAKDPSTAVEFLESVGQALTNVAKYAEASHATVRMARENGVLAVEVRDDGKGGARATPGSGLSGLADRVGAADGTLTITSPPGDGTIVRAELPLAG